MRTKKKGQASRKKEQFYIIEKLVKDRISKTSGIAEYFVKWEGYPVSENTWEPRDALPSELIKEYREEKKKKVKASVQKKQRGSKQRSPKRQRAPPDSDTEEDSQYEVEKILDVRKYSSGMKFKLRWKGYGSEDDTWEPLSHLDSCQDLLRAFKKKHPEKFSDGKRTPSSSRKSRTVTPTRKSPSSRSPSRTTSTSKRKGRQSNNSSVKSTPAKRARRSLSNASENGETEGLLQRTRRSFAQVSALLYPMS